jgi:glycosyltransferase involved in cell wall biosynthesis
VDNDSTDGTRDVATRYGATVVRERVHNIARVRNTGVGVATGDILVFLDADTKVPPSLLRDIAGAMRRERCVGGAVAVDYTEPRRAWVRWYLKGWAFWSRFFNMKQGAAQFCRTEAFRQLGGYDDRIYVGEDIEFYWRLSTYARRVGGELHFLREPRVVTSSRRFDRMSAWKLLLLTHPVVIWLSWKRKSLWKDWYDVPVR